jgi:threonine/homoserine/homoserine lactone efflux protein
MRSSGRAPPTGRRSARRTGVAALALFCTTAAAALVLAHVYHLGVPATLVALLGGLPGLYLAWSAYRDDRRDADTGAVSSLAEVADQLARAVGSQWEAEAAIRR